MTAFRKWFVALAVLLAVVGTASAAAYACTATSGVPARVRAEGRTELVGDVILNCDGDLPSQALTANVQIFLSTNITNRILSTPLAPLPATGRTDALLALNDPAPSAQVLDTVQAGYQPNIFSGIKQGDNSLLWLNIPLWVPVAPGTTTLTKVTTIRITNVRANAAYVGAAASGQFIPNQMTMFVTLYSTVAIAVNNPTQVVAAVLKGVDFSARNCKDSGGIETSYSQCSDWGKTAVDSTSHILAGVLKFSEGFDGSWKTQIGATQNQSLLGTITGISESGYVNYGQASPFGLPPVSGVTPGLADSATRFLVRFNNIPAGVAVFVSPREIKPYLDGSTIRYTSWLNSTGTDWTKAYLISVTDPTGSGASTGFGITGLGGSYDKSKSDKGDNKCENAIEGDGTTNLVQVPLAGGAGSATWQIFTTPVGTSTSVIEYISFGVALGYSAKPDQNSPALTGTTPGTVSGNFAPISSDDKMSVYSPVPRFADMPIAKDLIAVKECRSILLFSFVTARGGFDTGIAITNTTLDNSKGVTGGTDEWPFKTRPQSGVCKLWYIGDKEDGTSLAKPIQTSNVLAAGKQLVYTLFGGGGNIDATPGFQGYIIAVCDFELAHGFAFISDLGAQKLAMGYLALVMDKGVGSNRAGRTEALNQ